MKTSFIYVDDHSFIAIEWNDISHVSVYNKKYVTISRHVK